MGGAKGRGGGEPGGAGVGVPEGARPCVGATGVRGEQVALPAETCRAGGARGLWGVGCPKLVASNWRGALGAWMGG